MILEKASNESSAVTDTCMCDALFLAEYKPLVLLSFFGTTTMTFVVL